MVSPTSPDHTRYHLVDIYTSCNKSHVKQEILDTFTTPHSSLRVIIATIAFGLGVDCPDVRNVIYVGPSDDIEIYVQEIEQVVMENSQMLHYSSIKNMLNMLNGQC